jgi:two-component system response regulator VicR
MLILVAEDDELILKTIEHRLKKEGHQVIITHDGREALKKIKETLPDVIITDIMMPFFSGLEIVDVVKKIKEKEIPVIVLSAMGQENVVLEAFELGAEDYITKPFSPNELIVRIKRLKINVNRA